MPKQIWKLEAFDGGINNVDDPRDIQDNQFAELQDVIISRGKITMGAKISAFSVGGTYPIDGTGVMPRGYGLFAISTDMNIATNPVNTPSHYLFLLDDIEKVLYYREDTATGDSGTFYNPKLSISANVDKVWKVGKSKPCFYYIDGVLRISDGSSAVYYGTHTGADNNTILTDSAAAFDNDLIGAKVFNLTDGSSGTVASVAASTQLTLDDLLGGSDNSWDTADDDKYKIIAVNPTLWFGYIDRQLFSGEGSYSMTRQWYAYPQELFKPASGKVFGNNKLEHKSGSSGAVTSLQEEDLDDKAVNLWVRNAKDKMKKISQKEEQISNVNDRIFTSGSNWSNHGTAEYQWNQDGGTYSDTATTGADEDDLFTDPYLKLVATSDASHVRQAFLDGANWEDTGGASALNMVVGETYTLSYSMEISSYTSGTLTVGFGPVGAPSTITSAKNSYTAGAAASTQTLDFIYTGTTSHAQLIIEASTSSAFTVYFDHFSIKPKYAVQLASTTSTQTSPAGNFVITHYDNTNYTEQETVQLDHVHDGDYMRDWFFYGDYASAPISNAHMSTRVEADITAVDQTGNTIPFTYNDSLYLKVQLPTDASKEVWGPDGNYFSMAYNNKGTAIQGTETGGQTAIRLFPPDGLPSGQRGDITACSYIEWKIPNPYDEDWEVGKYIVLEFPYKDYSYFVDGADVSGFTAGSSFNIDRYEIHFHCNIFGGLSEGMMNQKPLLWADPFIAESGLVFNDTVNSGPKSWGVSYVYDGNQESGIHKYADKINLTNNYFATGLTMYHHGILGGDTNWDGSNTVNYRITGANFYFYDDDNNPYRIAECDFVKGMKSVTESSFPSTDEWATLNSSDVRISNTVFLNQLPTLATFQAYNGYNESEGGGSISAQTDNENFKNFRASFGNMSLNGRKLIVGPVMMDTDDGKGTVCHFDRVVGSPPGKFDTFPNKSNNIEVAKSDGDSIIGLETYADRLLQFKKNRMDLINISKSTEYLEDTFEGKGISHPAAAFKTDYGIVWANEDGCYFYNGENVSNLIENKINNLTWATHMDANSLVGFHSNSRKIIVTGGGSNNRNAYIFDLNLKSWIYMNNIFSNVSMTNFVKNKDGHLVWFEQNGSLRYWNETADGTANMSILTKDIDFGHPGVRKKIYKIYLTFKGDGDNVRVQYGVDGATPASNFYPITSGTDGSSTNASAAAKCLKDANTNDWLKAELKPGASINNISSFRLKISGDGSTAVADDFEINDISIIYRLKSIK